jgi:hypothetical protein
VWLWLPQIRTARTGLRLAVYACGLAGIALLAVSFAWRFGLGLDTPWYLLTLVSVGYVKTTPFVVALLATAAGAQLAAAAAGRYAPYPTPQEHRPPGPVRMLVRASVLAARERRRRREIELQRATGPGS